MTAERNGENLGKDIVLLDDDGETCISLVNPQNVYTYCGKNQVHFPTDELIAVHAADIGEVIATFDKSVVKVADIVTFARRVEETNAEKIFHGEEQPAKKEKQKSIGKK